VKVIFLDFDGVLNSVSFHTKLAKDEVVYDGQTPPLDRAAVEVLNKVVRQTGAMVVVSSTWRKGSSRTQLSGWLKDAGFEGVVIGATGTIHNAPRGHEIQEWLDQRPQVHEHRFGPVTHFVILDDDTDMADLYPKLVHVDYEDGLTEKYLPDILKHLE
jgi:hypothetical protein